MSQWTHVIGVIQTSPVTQEAVENAFGVPKTWKDMWYHTERYFRESPIEIPRGSEGSIVWHLQDTVQKVNENDSQSVIGEGSIISIEGDLRDFGDCDEDVQQIAEWFINGCKKLNCPRWATLSIEVEYGNSYIIEVMWKKYIIYRVDREQTLTVADLKAHDQKQKGCRNNSNELYNK